MLVRLVFQGDLANDTFATHKISSAIDACGGSAANLVNIMMLPPAKRFNVLSILGLRFFQPYDDELLYIV